MNFLQDLDRNLTYSVNSFSESALLDGVMIFLSSPTWAVVLALVLLIYLFVKKKKRHILAFLFALALLGLVDLVNYEVFKPYFARIRPCHHEGWLRALEACKGRFGFPSNHAANSFLLAGFLFFYRKSGAYSFYLGSLAIALASLVSFSRVYLGKHYLADVSAGAIVGLVCAYLGVKVFESLSFRLKSSAE